MNQVIKINENDINRLYEFYQDNLVISKNEHIKFMAKFESLTITAYKSGKVMFQGKKALYEKNMWITLLNLDDEIIDNNDTTKNYEKIYDMSCVGSDEVGTGDFFGPICVVACYVDKKDITYLESIGIKDSKNFNDETIIKKAKLIKDYLTYSLLVLDNNKYNELYKKGFNMNKIKAYLHNKSILNCLDKLDKKPNKVIVDQFCKPNLYFNYLKNEKDIYKDITFFTKAESKHLSVASASILARYAFILHFDKLSEISGFNLLKGASKRVDIQIKEIIDKKGEDYLKNIAKLNFKNLLKAKCIN